MKAKKHLCVKRDMVKIFQSKHGLSAIIATLLLVVLTVVAVSIIWASIKSMVDNNLETAGSCFNIFEKVKLNSEVSCYNYSSNELKIGVIIGDLEIKEVLASVSTKDSSSSFRIYEGAVDTKIKMSNGSYNQPLIFPAKNSGKTYTLKGFSEKPYNVQFIPLIGEERCDVVDSLKDIPSCEILV